MELNHFDSAGNAVMVDVGEKAQTERKAVARGVIRMNAGCFALVESGTAKKGDVLGTARIAGIMAAKKTSELIPLCHPVSLTNAAVDFSLDRQNCEITVTCTAKTRGQTGVEMEAMTGASVALLTIYDMCKAADRAMEISRLVLLSKSGGKSGEFCRDE